MKELVDKIKKRKSDLEHELKWAVMAFEIETGIEVTNLLIERTNAYSHGVPINSNIVNVKVEMKL